MNEPMSPRPQGDLKARGQDVPSAQRSRPPDPLPRDFYGRSVDCVARDLLGALLVHDAADGLAIGRIVETEAYFGVGDPASHAFRGPTPRSAIMFGPPGIAYVYFSYGMYCLLNVVAGPEGEAGAVLIRALRPVAGVELMLRRRTLWARTRGKRSPDATDTTALTSGPGKLTIAMGIDLAENGRDLTRGSLYIGRGERVAGADIVRGSRVGISAGTEHELRFHIGGDPFVSRG